MRWSVSLTAEGDRVIELEEVVELADAVAACDGIATGMGTHSYGAQIVVEAENSDQAVDKAMKVFSTAAEKAGLPSWPITRAETIADDEEIDYDFDEGVFLPGDIGPGT
jgi:DhnA family fructose-bisphosphate aldolase class Ia